MKKYPISARLLCLGVAAIAASGTAPVLAQGRVVLDEIIVTAQKREENLQEVPLSISAVSAEQLELRNIEGLDDLNGVAPNVLFRASPGSRLVSAPVIRGVGTTQPAIWQDHPIGLYLNGIYLGKAQGSVFDVVDIERVEVLRGPQGTLFGRNTQGGAINFITRRPSGEFSGQAKVELGNYNRRVGRLQLDLPRWGVASLGLAVRKERADGWARNRTGPDLGSTDSEAFRLSAKLDFSDRLVAVYDFDYSNIDQTPTPTSLLSTRGWAGTFPTIFGEPLGSAIESAMLPYERASRPSRVSTNMTEGQKGPYEKSRSRAHALTLEFEVTDHDTLKYIGARRTMSPEDSNDIDGTPLSAIIVPNFPIDLDGDGEPDFFMDMPWGMEVHYDRATRYKQTSHELQWIASRSTLNWVAGLYYFKDDGTTGGSQSMSLLSFVPQRSEYGADTKAWAAFGQLDWRFAEDWTATVGTRYTKEKRSGWSHRYTTDGFGGPLLSDMGDGLVPLIAYSKSFNDTTPVAALSWAINDDVNAYARIAKGFQSGGFSSEVADPRVATPYKPQASLTKEIGIKSLWWDGRARLNAALFHNKITDMQISHLVPGTSQSFLVNAGEAIYKGAELEFALQLTDDWRISGNYGYLDTKFEKYLDNSLWLPGRPIIETASNRLAPYAPKHMFSVQLEGTLLHLGFGDLQLLLDYNFTDSVYLYAVNKSLMAPNAGGSFVKTVDRLPSTRNLNLRLQLSDVQVDGGMMDFSFFVRNLTDEDRMIQGIDFSMFRNAMWQEPRSYMFSVAYKW